MSSCLVVWQKGFHRPRSARCCASADPPPASISAPSVREVPQAEKGLRQISIGGHFPKLRKIDRSTKFLQKRMLECTSILHLVHLNFMPPLRARKHQNPQGGHQSFGE